MAVKIEVEIETCKDCPFKTEYYGSAGMMILDYWKCDQADKKIEDTETIPRWCPFRRQGDIKQN